MDTLIISFSVAGPRRGFISLLGSKKNADFGVWEDRPVPKGSNVTKDRLIRLNPFVAGASCREDLRLVSVWDEENQREVQLLTNLTHLSAATIGAIYKERWQIELNVDKVFDHQPVMLALLSGPQNTTWPAIACKLITR